MNIIFCKYKTFFEFGISNFDLKKINDILSKTHNKNIIGLVYLFVYKNIKAKLLGFDTYVDFMTNYYNSDDIRLILEKISGDLHNRCNLELKIISDMKYKYENDKCENRKDY